MADKTTKRVAIAEFYLVDDDTGSRKHIKAGETVEMTKRQFERAIKANVVHKDEDQDAEAAEAVAKKAKALAEQQQRKEALNANPSGATEMRTEEGERAARAADQASRDNAAAAARRESNDGTNAGRVK